MAEPRDQHDAIQHLVATRSGPAPLAERIHQAVEAGYDHVAVVQVGPDRTEGFQRWSTAPPYTPEIDTTGCRGARVGCCRTWTRWPTSWWARRP